MHTIIRKSGARSKRLAIRFLGAIFGQDTQAKKTTPKNTRTTTQSKSSQIPCIPALYASHSAATRNVPVFPSLFEKLPDCATQLGMFYFLNPTRITGSSSQYFQRIG